MHRHPHGLPTPLPPTTTPQGSHSSILPPLTPVAPPPLPSPWWKSRCHRCTIPQGKPNDSLRPPQHVHQVHSLQAPALGPSLSSALSTRPPSPSSRFQTTRSSLLNLPSPQSPFPPLTQSLPSPSRTPLARTRTMMRS